MGTNQKLTGDRIEKLKDKLPQFIQWDKEVLTELSDIVALKKTKIIVKDSCYDYIEPIETTNSLEDIIDAVQELYNQIKEDDMRSCFYIESVTIIEEPYHIELDFDHGT